MPYPVVINGGPLLWGNDPWSSRIVTGVHPKWFYSILGMYDSLYMIPMGNDTWEDALLPSGPCLATR